MTFLDSASASLMPAPVSDAMVEYIRLEERLGATGAARECEERIARCHSSLAALINCAPSEIALFDSATRAWQMAVSSIGLGHGDRVLMVSAEYGSNYQTLREVTKRQGAVLEVLDTDETGLVDLPQLAGRLGADVRLLTLPHVASNACVIQPLDAVVRVARRANVPVLIDCSQSIGQVEIDVRQIGCEMLCGTGRKWLRGPRGTAFLYVAESFLPAADPPFVSLHSGEWVSEGRFERHRTAQAFETWEASVAARLGLGVAAQYAMAWGINSISSRISTLAALLRAQLEEIQEVVIYDNLPQMNGIVTFCLKGIGARELRRALMRRGVHLGVVRASHARIDARVRRVTGDVVRASPHYFNVDEEILELVEAVKELASSSSIG